MEQMRLSVRRDDSVERAITTDASLVVAQDSDNITKTQSTTMSNDPISQEISLCDRPKCQETTLGDTNAQIWFETASKQSYDLPLLEVNTSRSREDGMKHQDDLMDVVSPTPYDSPLSGGHTPGSDEGRVETSTDKSLGEDASKQGRNDDKTEELNLTGGADTEVLVEDKGSGEKGGNTANQVCTARPELKHKTFKELQKLYQKKQKWIDDFVPMDFENEEKKSVEPKSKGKKGKRIKRVADSALKQKSSKKQKMMQEQESTKSDKEESADYEQEKEELIMWLTFISDEKETVDPKILSTNWKLYENYEVYKLLIDGTLNCLNLLVEKRYPLIKEMLEKMLNWKLEAEAKAESTMAFELLKFIKSSIEQ
nr:hypothetical protein [Tanacetum cinerariifolium]